MSERALFNRRSFLSATAGLATVGLTQATFGVNAVPRRARAISGDRNEPDWDQRLTITVGPKKAQITGSDDKVIQAAVDYVRRLGGGTVKILPGRYRLSNSVYLASRYSCSGKRIRFGLDEEPVHDDQTRCQFGLV